MIKLEVPYGDRRDVGRFLLSLVLFFILFAVFVHRFEPMKFESNATDRMTVLCTKKGGTMITNPDSWIGRIGGTGCSVDYEKREIIRILTIAEDYDKTKTTR